MELREFIRLLDKKGILRHVKKPVDIKYETSTVMKMVEDTPLLFENVNGFEMPIIANICSTKQLVALGIGCKENEIIHKLAEAVGNPVEPEVVPAEGYKEVEPDLTKIPILTYYPFDGGPYIASAIVIATDNEYGPNSSYHRMMVIDKDKLVLRILQRHFDEYLKRGLKEFAICIGNSIPVLVASAVSTAIDTSEMAIANALSKTDVVEFSGHKVPQAEIVMIAEVTGEEHDEGPFLDLTETMDIVRKQKVVRVKQIFLRDNPYYHGLLPGGLEHKILMGMPREPTIYREVSKVCEVRDVLVTPGGCSWLHGAVSIKKKHPDDGRKAIEAAFKGHKSMKHVFVVDDDIDIHNPHEIEWAMATRFQGDRDMIIKKEKGSSLDPSSDLKTKMTTKIGFDLTIPSDDIKSFKKPELPLKLNIKDYIE
jgi:2,5-furandicarboxylate decarboxylase 1